MEGVDLQTSSRNTASSRETTPASPHRWACTLGLILVFAACSGETPAGETWDQDDEPGGGVRTESENCGDGDLDPGEVCDGSALAGTTCRDFGYPEGTLACNDDCAGFLVEGCRGMPDWRKVDSKGCDVCDVDEINVEGECVSPDCGGESAPPVIDESFEIPTVEIEGPP